MVCAARSSVLMWCPLLAVLFPCMPAFAQSSAPTLQQHEQLAQQYLAAKQPAKAIPELQAIVVADPNNLQARANLGVLLFFRGQFADALPQLQAAVALQPELWKIRALEGIAERRTGHDAAGRADLEASFPHLDDVNTQINVGRDLIESYTAAGDLEKASEMISTLLKLKPTDPELLYISYRVHNDQATEALLGLALAAPNSAQTHQAMAHELQREHDVNGTITNLKQALALDPALPGIHFELAEALHASTDARLRAEAAEQYRLAVQTDPSDPKAQTRLGDIDVEAGDLPAAASAYKLALQLNPTATDAKIGLANVLQQQGDLNGAAALLEQAVAADPSSSLAHFRLSVVYRKLKRPADVERELKAYEHFKAEREKLKTVYQQMRVEPAGSQDAAGTPAAGARDGGQP